MINQFIIPHIPFDGKIYSVQTHQLNADRYMWLLWLLSILLLDLLFVIY